MLFRHLLPACRGVIGAQAILLLPGFILAEATLSYVGLGFPDTVPSWGSMLHQASNVNAIADFPWTLAPAAAIFAVTLRGQPAGRGALVGQPLRIAEARLKPRPRAVRHSRFADRIWSMSAKSRAAAVSVASNSSRLVR